MRAIVVNCSAPAYNLGAAKLANWLEAQGWQVTRYGGDPQLFLFGHDLVCLSVVFSWHAPIARDVALQAKGLGSEVWAGGPGLYGLRAWFEEHTGIKPQWKPDDRFDNQRGEYKMIYAVRGCAGEYIAELDRFHPCEWCNVPKIEGTKYVLDDGFQPAKVLLDNNLSGQPVSMQEFIIRRYEETAVPLLDANSGFEPSVFIEETLDRWNAILKGPWRFGFDHSREYESAKRMAEMLERFPAKRKRTYVMVGNESVEVCYERAMQAIAWGCEPHCQFELPHNALTKDDESVWDRKFVAEFTERGWTRQKGQDFCRYFNTFLWRNMKLSAYKPRVNEPEPFRSLAA